MSQNGTGVLKGLSCCAICTSNARRFATLSFSLTNQCFMYCSAASTLRTNLPNFFAASVHCFSSTGKLNNDRSRSRHPVLFSPSHTTLAPLQFPKHHSFDSLSLPMRTTNPTKSIIAPSCRRSHRQSCPVRPHMKTYVFFSSGLTRPWLERTPRRSQRIKTTGVRAKRDAYWGEQVSGYLQSKER